MPNLSRRAILRGTAAASVAAAAFSLPVIAASQPRDDAELLRLEADLSAAAAQFDRTTTMLHEAMDSRPEWAKHPLPLVDFDNPLLVGFTRATIALADIRTYNRRTEGIVGTWRNIEPPDPDRETLRKEWLRRRAEGRARVRWWVAQRRAIAAADARANIPGLVDEVDRFGDEIASIETAIVETPAAGLAGVAVKLRLMRRLAERTQNVPAADDSHFDWEWQPALAALRDIDRLAGAGGASA